MLSAAENGLECGQERDVMDSFVIVMTVVVDSESYIGTEEAVSSALRGKQLV